MRRIAALLFVTLLALCGCSTVPGTYAEEWVIMRLNGLNRGYKLVIDPGGIVVEVPMSWIKGKNGYWEPVNGWPKRLLPADPAEELW